MYDTVYHTMYNNSSRRWPNISLPGISLYISTGQARTPTVGTLDSPKVAPGTEKKLCTPVPR